MVDLFDLDHARKVLTAFGCAFGKLPEKPSETSKEQKEFLKQAVSGLAQEGKVICVRLALFAEMMKGKAVDSCTLKEVGGTEGVGVTFLEETFSAATDRHPNTGYHQKAARAVLKALLPETGSDIKGSMRSYAELLEASGYGSRPRTLTICSTFSTTKSVSSRQPTRKARKGSVIVHPRHRLVAEILPTDPRLSGSLHSGSG